MKCISIQEVGSRAPGLMQRLEKDRGLLVTDDDKPVGILFAPDEEALDLCMKALDQIRNLLALRRVQQASVERGLDKLTLDDINVIIAKSRRERGSA